MEETSSDGVSASVAVPRQTISSENNVNSNNNDSNHFVIAKCRRLVRHILLEFVKPSKTKVCRINKYLYGLF